MEIYERVFDYDDMKIAMLVQEFYAEYKSIMIDKEYENYEDLVNLCIEIRSAWEDSNELSEEEKAYIQCYAIRYLTEKFLEKYL